MEKSLQMYVSNLNYILLKHTLLKKAAEGNRRRVHTELVLYGASPGLSLICYSQESYREV